MSNAQRRIDISPDITIEEGISAAVLRPGEIVRLSGPDTYEHRPVGADPSPIRVVMTDQMRGVSYDGSYQVGETVRVGIPAQGQFFNVRIGANQNVVVPDTLQTAANGLAEEGAVNPIFSCVEDVAIVTGAGESALAMVTLTS